EDNTASRRRSAGAGLESAVPKSEDTPTLGARLASLRKCYCACPLCCAKDRPFRVCASQIITKLFSIKMIIGLTGRNAAGKGSVAEYLQQRHGFVYTSLSGAPLPPISFP